MVRDVYEQKPKDDEKNEKRFQVIIQEIQDGIENENPFTSQIMFIGLH